MRGLRLEISLPAKDRGTLEDQLTAFWNGKTEYLLNCQHEFHRRHSDEIARGSRTILNSFEVTAT